MGIVDVWLPCWMRSQKLLEALQLGVRNEPGGIRVDHLILGTLSMEPLRSDEDWPSTLPSDTLTRAYSDFGEYCPLSPLSCMLKGSNSLSGLLRNASTQTFLHRSLLVNQQTPLFPIRAISPHPGLPMAAVYATQVKRGKKADIFWSLCYYYPSTSAPWTPFM